MAGATPASAMITADATEAPASEVASTPRPSGVIVGVFLLGLVITAAVSWTSLVLNNHNDNRLLSLETEQAADVLAAALPNTTTPLASALQIAAVTNGSAARFSSYMSAYVGASTGGFTSASLWTLRGTSVEQVAALGSGSALTGSSHAAEVVQTAMRVPKLIVEELHAGQRELLAYALALPGTPYAVLVAHAIPADRRAAVAKNSAFSQLNYAIFLGPSTSPGNVLTTSFSSLPPSGPIAVKSIPWGDSFLTLETTARGHLGGTLPAQLPWIFAVLGLLLSVTAAWITEHLVRRRRAAERDSTRIRELYAELATLFQQQRTTSETLQRALLPRTSPEIAGMEFAVKYEPGAKGLEIGGDWYSIVAIDDAHFVFVIGDVSGHGLSAATVMAELRFTIRAYALEGNTPGAILEKCSKQLDVANGHFATVLIGSVDVARHEIAIANAGHLNPLLLAGDEKSFINTALGVPLGVSGESYDSVTISVPPRSSLIAFTDGLIERRGENLDVGLARLKASADDGTLSLESLLTKISTDLAYDASEDDVAMLGLRWLT
ncbi:MAG TPA: SpoIIE family protein phosphatase [Acidimicrobiales bacterium]